MAGGYEVQRMLKVNSRKTGGNASALIHCQTRNEAFYRYPKWLDLNT